MCQSSSRLERRIIMRRILGLLYALSILTACANKSELAATQPDPISFSTDPPPASTSEPDPVTPALTKSIDLSTVPSPDDDFFTQMGISLPAPTCNSLTQSQTEGPYYSPNTPERNSLLEEGMPGTRPPLLRLFLFQKRPPFPKTPPLFFSVPSK